MVDKRLEIKKSPEEPIQPDCCIVTATATGDSSVDLLTTYIKKTDLSSVQNEELKEKSEK